MISIILEISGFSNIFGTKPETFDSPQIEYMIDNKPKMDQNKTETNSTKWNDKHCPYIEDICIYEQKFHVFNKEDVFSLSGYNNLDNESFLVYLNMFNTSIWDINEYKSSNCYYSDIDNHIIIASPNTNERNQRKLNKWYVTTLSHLFYLYNYSLSIPYLSSPFKKAKNNLKYYLFIDNQIELLPSHHLFIQPFTRYVFNHFTYLFERIPCECYKRLIFCGFNKENKKNKSYFQPMKQIIRHTNKWNMKQIFPEMITFYNNWIDKIDFNINSEVIKWKYKILTRYLMQYNNKTDIDIKIGDILQWKFIGFCQNDISVGKIWWNLIKNVNQCNKKYLKQKIFCFEFNLNNHYHARDIVIIHRGCTMLIGNEITNGIWMFDKNNNKYIIEILPGNEASEEIIFWQSHLNHIVFNLDTQSKDLNFKVEWNKLTQIIDYLFGYCYKFDNNNNYNIQAKDIKLNRKIKRSGTNITVYNAYCFNSNNHSTLPWNFVYPQGIDECNTCSLMT